MNTPHQITDEEVLKEIGLMPNFTNPNPPENLFAAAKAGRKCPHPHTCWIIKLGEKVKKKVVSEEQAFRILDAEKKRVHGENWSEILSETLLYYFEHAEGLYTTVYKLVDLFCRFEKYYGMVDAPAKFVGSQTKRALWFCLLVSGARKEPFTFGHDAYATCLGINKFYVSDFLKMCNTGDTVFMRGEEKKGRNYRYTLSDKYKDAWMNLTPKAGTETKCFLDSDRPNFREWIEIEFPSWFADRE